VSKFVVLSIASLVGTMILTHVFNFNFKIVLLQCANYIATHIIMHYNCLVIDSYNKQCDLEFDKIAKQLFDKFDKDGNKYLEGKEIDIFVQHFTNTYVEKLLDFAQVHHKDLFENVSQRRMEELRQKLAIPAKLKIKKCFEDYNADFKLDFDEIKLGLKYSVESYWHDRMNEHFEDWLIMHLKAPMTPIQSPSTPRSAGKSNFGHHHHQQWM